MASPVSFASPTGAKPQMSSPLEQEVQGTTGSSSAAVRSLALQLTFSNVPFATTVNLKLKRWVRLHGTLHLLCRYEVRVPPGMTHLHPVPCRMQPALKPETENDDCCEGQVGTGSGSPYPDPYWDDTPATRAEVIIARMDFILITGQV